MGTRPPSDREPGRSRAQVTAARRRQALAAVAFVSLVLGAWLGSSAAHRGGPDPGAAQAASETAAPARKRGWRAHPGPVPILMYHGVDLGRDPGTYEGLHLSTKEFREQLDGLDRAGYEAVTLSEVERAWEGLGTLPPKPVVLTFDDGYHSQARLAAPELAKHRWPGVLNLAINNLSWSRGITDAEVRTMIAAGWQLASHTITHPDLRRVSDARLQRELAESKRRLERSFGVPVTSFCYPGGAEDARVQAAVKRAGYHTATAIGPEYASRRNRFELRRVRVDPGTGSKGLLAELSKLRSEPPASTS